MSDNDRHINQAGLDLIKQHEGLRLDAYSDPGTGGEPITIGYGHTGGVKMGDEITQEQADAYLAQDCEKFEKGVSQLVTVVITDNQYAALVSFSYNLGLHTLQGSTLLKLLNSNSPKEDAANEFGKWIHANGKVLPGLVTRREAEKDLFLKE